MARIVTPLLTVVALAVVVWQVGLMGEGDGSEDPPEGLASIDATVPSTSTTAAPTPEELVIARETRAAVAAAIDLLLAAESVEVELQGAETGYELSGSVQIDLAAGDYRSSELETYDTGTVVRSEHSLIGDTMYVRFDQGDDNDGSKPFSPVEVVADRQEFVDEAFTMSGRAGGSLMRIVRYLDEIPFDSWTLEPADVDGRPATGYQVRFEAADISRFLRDNDLELIGPRDHGGSTFYEFWIDDADGYLARIAIGGVHFQDGEALDGFGGELVYRPGGAVEIAEPEDE